MERQATDRDPIGRPAVERDRHGADDSLEAWRWRSYVAHLTDLGYDLDGGGPPDDELDEAIVGYRARARHVEP